MLNENRDYILSIDLELVVLVDKALRFLLKFDGRGIVPPIDQIAVGIKESPWNSVIA
jgi:hypothetical protein